MKICSNEKRPPCSERFIFVLFGHLDIWTNRDFKVWNFSNPWCLWDADYFSDAACGVTAKRISRVSVLTRSSSVANTRMA